MKLKKKFNQFTEKTGMINVYACPDCSKTVVYIYMDDGVTPHQIVCHKCGKVAYSQFASMTQPTRYWYRPRNIQELRLIAEVAYEVGKDEVYEGEDKEKMVEAILNNYVQHYNDGGLFSRTI